MKSMRNRLLLSTLGLFAVAWIAVAYMIERAEQHQLLEQFDVLLEQKYEFLKAIVRHEHGEGDVGGFAEELDSAALTLHLNGHRYGLEYQVFTPSRKLLFGSARAPAEPMLASEHEYRDDVIGGLQWRILCGREAVSGHWIAVGYRIDNRADLMEDIAEETLRPLSITMMLLAAMLWYLIGRSLDPISKLASEIKGRHPLALDTISAYSVPKEVEPMIDSLNRLFKRLEEAFDSYDQFTTNAAHELRTPLAGLSLQVEASLRATTESDRLHALRMVKRGVDRASRIVEQMLALARLNTLNDSVHEQKTSLYAPSHKAVQSIEALAEDRNVTIQLSGDPSTEVWGMEGLIEILVANLVNNAVLYSPRGGRVSVQVGRDENCSYIVVEDSGPGIPEEMRALAMQRFIRLPEHGGEGSGLGLAIVRRIVDLHGAGLTLSNAETGTGLRVIIEFPTSHPYP